MASSKKTRDAGQNVTWTQTAPATAVAVTMTGIQDTKVSQGISIKTEAADGDAYMSIMFMDMQNPTFSFESIEPRTAAAIPAGNRGTLVFSIRDAANLLTTAGGGFTYTVTNSYKMDENTNYQFREFGKLSIPFGCISSDGQTSPVTVTLL